MKGHLGSCLFLTGLVLGASTGSRPASLEARQASPAYTVMVAFQMSSPFVPDGRMTFADLAFSATFKNVVFVFDPTAAFGFCSIEAEEGRVFLTRHAFNDVEGGAERHRPWVEKEWPPEYTASLTVSSTELAKYRPGEDGILPVAPLVPPNEVKLRFCAEFGLLDLMWYSKLGSNALSSMILEFDAPWRKLVDGKPVTLKIPHDSSEPEEKGEWWIEFIPPKKR
jgi:hypothetical protein